MQQTGQVTLGAFMCWFSWKSGNRDNAPMRVAQHRQTNDLPLELLKLKQELYDAIGIHPWKSESELREQKAVVMDFFGSFSEDGRLEDFALNLTLRRKLPTA